MANFYSNKLAIVKSQVWGGKCKSSNDEKINKHMFSYDN